MVHVNKFDTRNCPENEASECTSDSLIPRLSRNANMYAQLQCSRVPERGSVGTRLYYVNLIARRFT